MEASAARMDAAGATTVIARLDRATQYSRAVVIERRSCGVLGPAFAGTTHFIGVAQCPASHLLLHILDAGKGDAFCAFADIAEIEFILGEEHRIAVDVVGDAGTVG